MSDTSIAASPEASQLVSSPSSPEPSKVVSASTSDASLEPLQVSNTSTTNSADTDGDGLVDENELAEYLKTQGIKPSFFDSFYVNIRSVIKRFSKDKTKKTLDKNEMNELKLFIEKKQKTEKFYKDGFVDENRLKQLTTYWNFKKFGDTANVKDLLDRFGTDGILNKEQFKELQNTYNELMKEDRMLIKYFLSIFRNEKGFSEEFYVKRTSGQLEPGWNLNIDKDASINELYLSVPVINKQNVVKTIPINELLDINKELIDRKLLLIPTIPTGDASTDAFIKYLDNSKNSQRPMGSWTNRMEQYCAKKDENKCDKDENGNFLYKGCKYETNSKKQIKCVPLFPTDDLVSKLPKGKKYNLEPPFPMISEENLKKIDDERIKDFTTVYKINSEKQCEEKKTEEICNIPHLLHDNKPITNVCKWEKAVLPVGKMGSKAHERAEREASKCVSDEQYTYDKYLMTREQNEHQKIVEDYFKKIKAILDNPTTSPDEKVAKTQEANNILKEFCSKKDITNCNNNLDKGCFIDKDNKCIENKSFLTDPNNFKLRGNLKKIVESIKTNTEKK